MNFSDFLGFSLDFLSIFASLYDLGVFCQPECCQFFVKLDVYWTTMYLYHVQEDEDQQEMQRSGCYTQPCAAPRLESDWNMGKEYYRVFFVFFQMSKKSQRHPVDH